MACNTMRVHAWSFTHQDSELPPKIQPPLCGEGGIQPQGKRVESMAGKTPAPLGSKVRLIRWLGRRVCATAVVFFLRSIAVGVVWVGDWVVGTATASVGLGVVLPVGCKRVDCTAAARDRTSSTVKPSENGA